MYEQNVGEQFTEWPLHVTVVSWARSELATAELAQALSESLRTVQPFEAVVGSEDKFANGTVLVNAIRRPTGFDKLFEAVKETEDRLGFEFVSTMHPSYEPHVTVQRAERLRAGDVFSVSKLYIVEQRGDYKEVVGEVYLGR